MTLSNDGCFMGQFNGALLGQALVVLDEIVHNFEDVKSLYNALKPYVTEPTITYRNLYAAHKQLKNVSSFIMTGNHDMVHLEANDKDRRILVCPVSDSVKSYQYCNTLDRFVASDDVQYSFFWYCQRNQVVDWNEKEELKKLPISEEKKTMIQYSLDTLTIFLKSYVNDPCINKPMKPKHLYRKYEAFMHEEFERSKPMGKVMFMERILKFDTFVQLNVMKYGGSTSTSHFVIDRQKLIDDFTERHYWAKYDDILENPVVIPADEHDKNYEDIILSQQQQIKKMQKALQMNNDIILMTEILHTIRANIKKRAQILNPMNVILKDKRPRKVYDDQVDELTALLN
jgi:hypothetical protein